MRSSVILALVPNGECFSWVEFLDASLDAVHKFRDNVKMRLSKLANRSSTLVLRWDPQLFLLMLLINGQKLRDHIHPGSDSDSVTECATLPISGLYPLRVRAECSGLDRFS